MIQQQEIELERRKQDYADKMDADLKRYEELLKTKEEEAK
jgi:hypothetical protein